MSQILDIQDKELYKIYQSCKYEYWVAYLYLFIFGWALQRFYLGDLFSRKLAIAFIITQIFMFSVLRVFLEMYIIYILVAILVFGLFLYDLFNLPRLIKERNLLLIKDLKKIEDIKFRNRQYTWKYFAPVVFLGYAILYFIHYNSIN